MSCQVRYGPNSEIWPAVKDVPACASCGAVLPPGSPKTSRLGVAQWQLTTRPCAAPHSGIRDLQRFPSDRLVQAYSTTVCILGQTPTQSEFSTVTALVMTMHQGSSYFEIAS